MNTPMKPDAGSVLVIRSIAFAEFEPEIVGVFQNYAAGLGYVKEKLAEDPGDLFMVCRIDELWFADVTVKDLRRNINGRWVQK